jgi:hypothetical protein
MLIWNLIKPIKSLVNQTITMINQWKHSKYGDIEMYKQYAGIINNIYISKVRVCE